MGQGGAGQVRAGQGRVRNKTENSSCPAGKLKTNATCPPRAG